MLGIKWYENRFKIQLKGCYRMKINSKAFTIPILTAIAPTSRCTIAVYLLSEIFHSGLGAVVI